MTTPTPLPKTLLEAAEVVDRELRRDDKKPMKLETNGNDALTTAYARYIADVGTSAVKLARRDGLQCVERLHVEVAARRFGTGASESVTGAVLSTAGGLLVGAGLGGVYNVVGASKDDYTIMLVITSVLLAVGFVLLFAGGWLVRNGRQRL